MRYSAITTVNLRHHTCEALRRQRPIVTGVNPAHKTRAGVFELVSPHAGIRIVFIGGDTNAGTFELGANKGAGKGVTAISRGFHHVLFDITPQ